MGLELQYECGNTAATSQQLAPWFQIINNGSTAVPLSSLTIHYFYTKDGSASTDQNFACDYAQVSCSNISAIFNTFTGTSPDADEYLEVQFAAGAGSLAAGTSTGAIQTRIYANGYPTLTQTNDYSFNASLTSFADWMQITLYQNGTLVWGTEP
jgi:hypothetical protein